MTGIFKVFVSKAKNLCSEKYLDEVLHFFIDMVVENRYDRIYFYSIIWENKYQALKTENTDRNIVNLPSISILGPKKEKIFKR